MANEQMFLLPPEHFKVSFRLGGVTAPGVSALRSPDVLRDMLLLGLFSLDRGAPGILKGKRVIDGGRIEQIKEDLLASVDAPTQERLEKAFSKDPHALLYILFDYAFDAVPRTPEDPYMIDVSDLSEHVPFVGEGQTFEISEDFMNRIRQFAQLRINMEEMAAKRQAQAPTGREEARS